MTKRAASGPFGTFSHHVVTLQYINPDPELLIMNKNSGAGVRLACWACDPDPDPESVFTRMSGENYRGKFRFYLLCSYGVFGVFV